MLAGQYVVHDGATWQVAAITGGHVGNIGPAPTVYELRPLEGGPSKWLRNPRHTDLHLTVECVECRLPAGFGACFATGTHAGPAAPRTPSPVVLPPVPSLCCCDRTDCPQCAPVRLPRSPRKRLRVRSW